MGEIVQTHQTNTGDDELILHFGGIFFIPHGILTKHNKYQGNSSRLKIWGPFYTPKGEGLFGGKKKNKIQFHEKESI